MGRKNEKKSDMWKLYSMHNLDWKQGKIRVKVDSIVSAEGELNTRNSTKRWRKASFGWVSDVQHDLLEKKWPI